MRTRNREVNIFNMSLLDILTGMLGAFLFLMLGLVPYYMKTQNQKAAPASASSSSEGEQIPKIMILEVTGHWFSPTQVGIFLYGPNHDPTAASKANTWWTTNPNNPMLRRSGPVIDSTATQGPGWGAVSTSVYANERYLVAFQVPTMDSSGPPKGYARLGFTNEELITQETPGKKGNTSYTPITNSFLVNASRATPGTVYGAFWITTTEDKSKPWSQQDNYKVDWVLPGNTLPQGVVPLVGIDARLPIEDESQLAGIGAEVSSDTHSDQINDHLLVKSVFPDGPAAKSGIQAGDQITQINGMNVAGRKFPDVVQGWLRGKAGSPLQISIRRSGEPSPLTFVVERAALESSAGR